MHIFTQSLLGFKVTTFTHDKWQSDDTCKHNEIENIHEIYLERADESSDISCTEVSLKNRFNLNKRGSQLEDPDYRTFSQFNPSSPHPIRGITHPLISFFVIIDTMSYNEPSTVIYRTSYLDGSLDCVIRWLMEVSLLRDQIEDNPSINLQIGRSSLLLTYNHTLHWLSIDEWKGTINQYIAIPYHCSLDSSIRESFRISSWIQRRFPCPFCNWHFSLHTVPMKIPSIHVFTISYHNHN